MVRYDRVWELCKETGKKRSHLSKAMGHSERYLLDARKQNTNIKPEELATLAAELNTTPEYLTGETDDPTVSGGIPAFSVTHLSKGISVYKGRDSEIDSKLSDIQEDFRIVYRSSGIVITVDSSSGAADEDIQYVVSLYAETKKSPALSSEGGLDADVIKRLVQLTPAEMDKVDAFVQGLLASR